MNKVFLIGNLTKNPELTNTGSGIPVCRFTLAVSRRFSNSDGVRDTDFLPVVVWRTQAEHCNKYLKKAVKRPYPDRFRPAVTTLPTEAADTSPKSLPTRFSSSAPRPKTNPPRTTACSTTLKPLTKICPSDFRPYIGLNN